MGIIELATKMKAVNVRQLASQAVEGRKEALVEINRLQLRQGEDAESGAPLKPYLSLSYADFKASLSTYYAEFGTPDLFLTGSFQNAMTAKVSGNTFEITSSDGKTSKLASKYKPVFGINVKKQALARSKFDRELIRLFKLKVGLT